MTQIERVKGLSGVPASRARVTQLLIATGGFLFLLILLFIPYGDSVVPESRQVEKVNVDDIRAAYDPIVHKARLQGVVNTPCVVKTPTREEIAERPKEWVLSRYVSYYNIVRFLEDYLDKSKHYKVHDFGLSLFLNPFQDHMDINRSGYPVVDIHKTPYEEGTYDIVASDQVIEHILFPHAAILEMKRILKPGGLLIVTTCAYNPYHGARTYGDYWRFMPEGLKVLALPFDGGIKMCGGWGTKDVIAARAKHGLLTPAEKKESQQMFSDAASKNDERDPFTTWVIAQK